MQHAQSPSADFEFPGYQIRERIFLSRRSIVFRATRTADNKPVIIKALTEEFTTVEEVSRYQHEFQLLKRCQSPLVIKAYALERYQGSPYLVMEDTAGLSLRQSRPYEGLGIAAKLQIASKIAGALGAIHNAGAIHRDINPSNIVYNHATGELRIIDFGIATLGENNHLGQLAINQIEGSLPYISPEQTGRMNRSCDYRSDLYSLGVTLYELFTGRLPFDYKDPLKTIHYHLAKMPTPPEKIKPDLSPTVASIITKLLAKQAEDRYQSAWGLRTDIALCIESLEETGAIKPFTIASSDIPDKFLFPEKLYGREQEVSQLLRCFDRVCEGQQEIILVEGPTGVGKTSLVKEIYLPIAARRGYFAAGRCQELNQNMPFGAILEALRDLVRQLLTETEDKIEIWRHKIHEAIGMNGSLITSVIPELAAIIGNLDPVQPLNSVEAEKNRFYLVFKNFVQVFCRPEHPLVLFLDDIQWLDQSSIALVKQVSQDAKSKCLLLIGSVRQSALDHSHELNQALASLTNVKIQRIKLNPLGINQISDLLHDCLHASRETLMPLAKWTLKKTGGNPFFMEQFLRQLISDGLIWFDPTQSQFTWNLEAIRECQITGNVVDLLAAKISKLPQQLQKVLIVAGFMGDEFDCSVISRLNQQSEGEVQWALGELKDAGFLVRRRSHDNQPATYGFSHSRFQQAAYHLVPKTARPDYHYRIGKRLLALSTPNTLDEHIFEIVSQLNAAISRITSAKEQVELAHLNLVAGRRSMKSSGYSDAFHFFQNGLKLMPDQAWHSHYALNHALHSEGAQAAFLAGRYKAMHYMINGVIRHGKKLLDQMPVYEISVHGAIAENKFQQAAILGKHILAKLGRRFPANPSAIHIAWALLRVHLKLSRRGLTHLARLPAMTNPKAKARINFEFALAQSIYFCHPKLIPLMVMDAIDLSLKHGNAPVSPYIYSCYGMMLAGLFGRYQQAEALAQLAQKIYQKIPGSQFQAPLLVSHNVFIKPWIEPLAATLAPLQTAYQAGLDVGDQEFASHAAMAFCYHGFYAGRPLEELSKDMATYHSRITAMNQKGGVYILALYRQFCHNLMHKSAEHKGLDGSFYQEAATLESHNNQGDYAGIFANYLVRMQLAYLFGHNTQALAAYAKARPLAINVVGTIHEAIFVFYSTLVLIRNLETKTGLRKLLAARALAPRYHWNLRLMRKWQRHCPATFQHKLLILEAEWAKLAGRALKAQKKLDHAIHLAKKNGFLNELALAHELSALLQTAQLSPIAASAYMKKARHYYHRWGANNKVYQIECQHPALVMAHYGGPKSTTSTVSSTATSTIDVATLKQALLAIAEEKVHSLMIEKIINTAIQFAGASRGVLLLKKDEDRYYVEADGTVDADNTRILQALALEEERQLPHPVINYVINTAKPLVIDNATVANDTLPGLSRDQYISGHKVKSILCMPIKVGIADNAKIVGIVYLENRIASNCFTPQRTEILEIISLAAAGRLELSIKAATDGLTGLYNHEYFQNMLVREFLQSRRNLRDLSVIMVDIDHFKQVNDRWGHQVGDLILKKVSATIQNVCRRSDVVARYGGEEIGIILPETDALHAKLVADRLLQAIATSGVNVQGQELRVTASLGVASLNQSIADVAGLLRAADEALYHSKKTGRNRVTQAGAYQSLAPTADATNSRRQPDES